METKKIVAIGVGILVVIILSVLGLSYAGKINIGTQQQANVVDCAYTESIGACDPATGTKTITRKITTNSSNGGKACPSEKEVLPCDVDCVYTENKGMCDPSTGTITINRNITTVARNKGVSCPLETEVIPCDVDCVYTENKSGCDPTTGTITINRTITTTSKNKGLVCPLEKEVIPCDVNCVVSEYTWGDCRKSDGTQIGTRTILVDYKNEGTRCPSLTYTRNCDVDCEYTFGNCDLQSGTKPVNITLQSQNYGKVCPVAQSCLLQSQIVKDVSLDGTSPVSFNADDSPSNLVLPISSISENVRSLWDPISRPNYVLQYIFNPDSKSNSTPTVINGIKLVQLGDTSHDIKTIMVHITNPLLPGATSALTTISPLVGTAGVQTFDLPSRQIYTQLYLQLYRNDSRYQIVPQRLQFY